MPQQTPPHYAIARQDATNNHYWTPLFAEEGKLLLASQFNKGRQTFLNITAPVNLIVGPGLLFAIVVIETNMVGSFVLNDNADFLLASPIDVLWTMDAARASLGDPGRVNLPFVNGLVVSEVPAGGRLIVAVKQSLEIIPHE